MDLNDLNEINDLNDIIGLNDVNCGMGLNCLTNAEKVLLYLYLIQSF